MRKMILLISVMMITTAVAAQRVDSIFFHLYTDSLKKGFYNYINVDGKLTNGSWTPLDSTQVLFLSDAGYFKGNDLFIDSSYKGATARIRVVLKSNSSIWKETVIYIRKRGFTERLKTNDEILDELRQKGRKSKG